MVLMIGAATGYSRAGKTQFDGFAKQNDQGQNR
jgi:hypothetical protein